MSIGLAGGRNLLFLGNWLGALLSCTLVFFVRIGLSGDLQLQVVIDLAAGG